METTESTGPGIWITADQARLLRDMCQNATAPDGKTKILLGETQLALEEQLGHLQPPSPLTRQQRRAQDRQHSSGRQNGTSGRTQAPVAAVEPA